MSTSLKSPRDGETEREALGRRSLDSLQVLVDAHTNRTLSFDQCFLAIKALIDAVAPFVDPETKHVLNFVVKRWHEEDARLREAERQQTQLKFGEFGAWS